MSNDYPTQDDLRLEVGVPPVGPHNLIANPDGHLGGWGWATPTAGTKIRSARTLDGLPTLRFDFPTGGTTYSFTSEVATTSPNRWARAQFEIPADLGLNANDLRGRVQFLDAARNVLAQGPQTPSLTGASTLPATVQTAAAQAPAGTAYVRLRVDVNRTAVIPIDFTLLRQVVLAEASTAGQLVDLFDLEAATFTDILGDVGTVQIDRDELSLSSLTAVLRNSDLDPAAGGLLLRPGRRVRHTVWVDGAWDVLFDGHLLDAKVAYDFTKRPEQRATITLTADDAVNRLANATRTEGVATIAELPHVLEGAGVPWNVNGSGNQVANAVVVSNNEGATALDQLAITRDSTHGFVWVDRYGVVQAWDYDELGADMAGVLTEEDYTTFEAAFDTSSCINEVTLRHRRLNLATGGTVEVPYGPYRAAASIDAWGVHAAEFTVQGLADNDAAMAAFAEEIFAANATPTVRITTITVPVRSEADLTAVKALVDLYALVEVRNGVVGLTQTARVVTISHEISAGRWFVTLGFVADGLVAIPQPAPPLEDGTGAGGPSNTERSRITNAQSIPNNTHTTVMWNEGTDAGFTSYASGVWTIKTEGRYLITANVVMAAATAGRRVVRIRRNGTEIARTALPAAASWSADEWAGSVTTSITLDAGDTVDVQVLQNSGSALGLQVGSRATIASL